MKNKIALVTGGMGKIGTAVCHKLIKNGAFVIASYNRDSDHDSAECWRKQQQSIGYGIPISYVDVANFNSCEKMIKEIEDEFGGIDILINNAGNTRDFQLYKINPNQWHEVMKTNLDSIVNVTRNAINGMLARKYGRIINISSIDEQQDPFIKTNYSTPKAGIHSFTKSLAQEVSSAGITVNTVSAGYIGTDVTKSIPTMAREKVITQTPVRHSGRPEEAASIICFLASEKSGFITGTNIAINAGQNLF